jgi:hypothetical protein
MLNPALRDADRVTSDITIVTGIIDIGRDMSPEGFARPFSYYSDKIALLLELDIPIVVYADRQFHIPHSQAGRRLVPTDAAALERFPYFDKVQQIRASSSWKSQTAWLPSSPQAFLPHYNPLIMSKLLWLADQAKANPFGTRYFAWLDGGICNTVPLDLLRASLASPRLLKYLRKLLLLCFPYKTPTQVHGFEHAALARYSNVAKIEWVARGGFFGGPIEFVLEAARLYDVMLSETLGHGYMGTEESVFTILANLHPGVFDRFYVGEDGLLARFFAKVSAENQ